MEHEKLITREDGSTVRVVVGLYTDLFANDHKWSCYTLKLEPGKAERHFKNVPFAATPEEILEAKNELWNKIKPTL